MLILDRLRLRASAILMAEANNVVLVKPSHQILFLIDYSIITLAWPKARQSPQST